MMLLSHRPPPRAFPPPRRLPGIVRPGHLCRSTLEKDGQGIHPFFAALSSSASSPSSFTIVNQDGHLSFIVRLFNSLLRHSAFYLDMMGAGEDSRRRRRRRILGMGPRRRRNSVGRFPPLSKACPARLPLSLSLSLSQSALLSLSLSLSHSLASLSALSLFLLCSALLSLVPSPLPSVVDLFPLCSLGLSLSLTHILSSPGLLLSASILHHLPYPASDSSLRAAHWWSVLYLDCGRVHGGQPVESCTGEGEEMGRERENPAEIRSSHVMGWRKDRT